jgi:hypothetical protein
MIYKTLHDIGTNNDLQTLQDLWTNYDLQNTTWNKDKLWSTKHYMTEGQMIIYKILYDIGTNNDL